MIELVIAACLASAPECCEFRLLYDPYAVSLMMCMVAGQPEVARWQADHAGWRVTPELRLARHPQLQSLRRPPGSRVSER